MRAHTCTQRVAAMLQSVTAVQVRSRGPARNLEASPEGFRIHPRRTAGAHHQRKLAPLEGVRSRDDGGQGITDEKRKQQYLHNRVDGHLAHCEAPEYTQYKHKAQRKKRMMSHFEL